MTICKDITTQLFDVDRFEFITDGKLAIRRNDPIPPDINAMPLEAHPLLGWLKKMRLIKGINLYYDHMQRHNNTNI